MPERVNVEERKWNQAINDRDTRRKQINKDYVNMRFHARDQNVKGGSVLLKKRKQNKLSSCYEKKP